MNGKNQLLYYSNFEIEKNHHQCHLHLFCIELSGLDPKLNQVKIRKLLK